MVVFACLVGVSVEREERGAESFVGLGRIEGRLNQTDVPRRLMWIALSIDGGMMNQDWSLFEC